MFYVVSATMLEIGYGAFDGIAQKRQGYIVVLEQ